MTEIDVVFISNARNGALHAETDKSIQTLYKSEDPSKIKFNVFVVESNLLINYDHYNHKYTSPINVVTIHPDVPFGYHKYLNIGRKAGNADWVVLCNNDLEFARYWATNMLRETESRNIWSGSPVNPNKTNHKNFINTGVHRTGWGVASEVAGWCIFQKRELYDHIGDLDEEFDFWYCDNDYAMTLYDKNFYHILVIDSIVYHHNGTEGSTLRREEDQVRKQKLTSGGADIFNKKWKKIKV